MYAWFQQKIHPLIRLYSIIPLLSCFALNMVVYSGSMILCADWKHYDLTTTFDKAVPLVPWFMYIYFGAFVFWIVNYIIMGHFDKEHFYKFVTADMMSRILCGVFFLLIPTTLMRPDTAMLGNAPADNLLRFLYSLDQPVNLFPSIHCLVSWFCFIGIRGQKKIPVWYQVFSCIFALAVCVSTQLTKQHYILDAVVGVLMAEGLYFLSNHCSLYRYVMRFFDRINDGIKQLLTKETHLGEQEKNSL